VSPSRRQRFAERLRAAPAVARAILVIVATPSTCLNVTVTALHEVRRASGLGKNEGQRHREAGGVSGCDQLRWV
jgi:hypothetical protein